MTTRGLVARLDAAAGHEEALDKLLVKARSIVMRERGTTAWFGLRFGHGEFGIFDAFPDEVTRDEHLGGGVVAALRAHADLLDGEPVIERVDVLADKLTEGHGQKALLLRLPIKPSHIDDAETFLRSSETVVADEPATTAWFALRFDNGDYGVFDVFPDAKARRTHLRGEIPKRLALHGLPWLNALPEMSFADILAQKAARA